MKLVKKADKTIVRMSQKEWEDMGKQAGWLNKEASPLLIFISRLIQEMTPKVMSDPEYPEIDNEQSAIQMLKNMTLEKLEDLAEKYDYKMFF